MKSIAKLSILSLLFSVSAGILSAQRYVNQEWSSITGLPLNIHWSSSMIASTGHIITVGNTYTSGQSTNVLLTKYATDGTIIWQVEYDNPDNLEDYGIAVCEDNTGNFYVAGTSFRSSSSSLELTVLKFNSSGVNQWAYFFDGSASGDDIPAEIVSDGTNVYVTGGTESTSTASDFVTIKVKNDGSILWTKYYDHNSLDDVAVEVDINQSGDIIVSGGSADQANLYDMATVKYDASGNVLNVHRSNYNVGLDQPTCFDIDASGNSVIGGYYVPAPGEMKISIISLDDTLGLNWSILHDPTAGEDKITGLVTDASGNIYVTGHVEESPGYFKCYTAKFDNSDSLVWQRDYQSPSGGAFGKTIALSANGEINVAGVNYDEQNDTNIVVLIYRHDGKLITSKEYNAGGTEIASNLETDFWGNIYIHGTSSSNGNGYVTLKYSFFDRQLFEVNDTVDSIDYIDNELLIQFYPQYIDSSAIDDKGKTYGILSEFVSSAAIDTLNALYEGQYDFGRMQTLKIFTGLSTVDSTSITRSGDTITLPPFFATLLVLTPSQLDELAASVHLDTAGTGILEFAQVNQIAYPDDLPNDYHFTQGDQDGLESSNSPENDINMDRAWDIQKGKDNVKVGIIDSGIDWDHIDFNETGTYSTNSNHSKVKNGYDFYNFISPFSTVDNDSYGHGTKVSGIVGAIRNNNEGVAGIAGGNDSTSNFGATLIDLKVGELVNGKIKFPADRVIEAIVEGAKDQPSNSTNPGYAVHIFNMSFGHKKPDKAEETAIRFAYNNECVIAASAGNDNKEKPRYPSSYADRMVIRVGASSDDGARYNHPNFGSNYGHGLDIIAPGIPPLVYTTNNSDTGYTNFAQTSAAAPHVAGVATLLHSQVKSNYNPNQLAPEDVEQLIEMNRTDVGAQGYDVQNGHGRLNAGDVLEKMEWPFYWVEHNSNSTTNYDSTLLFQDTKVNLERGHDGIKRGRYKCDIVQVTCTLSHNIGNADLLGAWALNGSTFSTPYGFSTSALKPEANIQLTFIDDNTAILRGYVYHFKNKWPLGGSVNQWIPFQPGQAGSFGYSMHLYDEEASGTNESQNVLDQSVRVYPNPTANSQRIEISESGSVVIELIDLQGRVIQNVYQGSSNGNLSIDNDIQSLNSGIYIYEVSIDNNSHSIRIIKQ